MNLFVYYEFLLTLNEPDVSMFAPLLLILVILQLPLLRLVCGWEGFLCPLCRHSAERWGFAAWSSTSSARPRAAAKASDSHVFLLHSTIEHRAEPWVSIVSNSVPQICILHLIIRESGMNENAKESCKKVQSGKSMALNLSCWSRDSGWSAQNWAESTKSQSFALGAEGESLLICFLFLPLWLFTLTAVAGEDFFFADSFLQESEQKKSLADFLLVLMWPTWPQLAHFRAVPSVFFFERPLPLPVGAGVAPSAPSAPGDAAVEGDAALPMPFARSRACLRPMLRSRRSISACMLRNGLAVAMKEMHRIQYSCFWSASYSSSPVALAFMMLWKNVSLGPTRILI